MTNDSRDNFQMNDRQQVQLVLGIICVAIPVLLIIFHLSGSFQPSVSNYLLAGIAGAAGFRSISLARTRPEMPRPQENAAPTNEPPQRPPEEFAQDLRKLGYKVDQVSAGTWQIYGKGGVDKTAYGPGRLQAIHSELVQRPRDASQETPAK